MAAPITSRTSLLRADVTTMKRHTDTSPLARQDGFSLVELMVVAALLSVILAAAYMAIDMVTVVSDGIMARNQAQDQGQLAVEKMVRELRMVQPTSDDKRFPVMEAKRVMFYADINHDGLLDRVTYTVSGSTLTRAVAYSGDIEPASTDFGPDSTPVKIAEVDPSVGTVFQYWNNGPGNTTPTTTTKQSDVMAVKISLTTAATSGSQKVAVAIPTTTVHMRANDQGLRD
jgi:prepilin-type N-terminal cleavage/methylation domain-containing protein